MSEYVFNYSHYRNQINKKTNYNFSIIFLVLILLLGCCVFLRPTKLKTTKFYFIQVAEFQTYQSAINVSQQVNAQGGAGYIYCDGNYHVLVAFYSNYDDAKAVLNNIETEYEKASIFSLSSKQFSNKKNLSKTQNKAIKNFVDETENIVYKLENFSLEFFSNKLDFKTLSIHIANLKKDFDDVYDNLLISFKTNSKFNLAIERVNNMLQSISKLNTYNEQELSGSIRYEIINFTVNRYQFLSCF